MPEPNDKFSGRNLLVGVTGGIAAYKTAIVVSRLVERKANVQVVMTEAATRFVGPATFRGLTGTPVYLDLWEPAERDRGTHISLADWTEACVVAPATADILGKMACGLADSLLPTLILALEAPVLLAPAMNERMWAKAVVRENADKLATLGYHFVGPARGRLACGDEGEGRMSEPDEIITALEQLLSEPDEQASGAKLA